ncbi:hypothetical protein FGO68_gene11743 [Halteria grandinella]|uniref:Mitochondrial pyruvate carrier n=1 Tax=Halteria grandinella TaxID=5974 RepID=A0A8J8SYT7_HALGN|nr:hypothetical protein FGO68_gene11743 [Halteria grandinella]
MALPWPTSVRSILLHPAGPFTIFFWAPTFKWLITAANVKDFEKPAENISPYQQFAIGCSGFIWTRYGFVITPINYNFSFVNFVMALSASYQLYRKSQVPAEKGGFWGTPKV